MNEKEQSTLFEKLYIVIVCEMMVNGARIFFFHSEEAATEARETSESARVFWHHHRLSRLIIITNLFTSPEKKPEEKL